MDDLTLLKARRGDKAALAQIVRHHAPMVHALVRRLGPAGRVDDLCQEIFIKVVRAIPSFSPSGPARLSTWILTIAHRHLADASRRRTPDAAPLEEAFDAASSDRGPDERLLMLESRQALEMAIAELPEAYRRAFLLAAVHEQPLESIAEAEGVPLGTVKSRLHRARAALAQRLEPMLDHETRARSAP